MGFPGKIKFPIYPIILPVMATRVSFDQCSVLSTTLKEDKCRSCVNAQMSISADVLDPISNDTCGCKSRFNNI